MKVLEVVLLKHLLMLLLNVSSYYIIKLTNCFENEYIIIQQFICFISWPRLFSIILFLFLFCVCSKFVKNFVDIEEIGVNAHNLTNLAGRTESNFHDIWCALETLGLDFNTLQQWATQADTVPFTQRKIFWFVSDRLALLLVVLYLVLLLTVFFFCACVFWYSCPRLSSTQTNLNALYYLDRRKIKWI